MTENQKHENLTEQVTFREFSELDGDRLHEQRYQKIYGRLIVALRQNFGNLSPDRCSDFISEAIRRFFARCHKERAFGSSGRPLFPYLLKTAERVAFEYLSPDGKTKYQKARRLECSSAESEIVFESLSVGVSDSVAEDSSLRVAAEFLELWNTLTPAQRFVLEANANASINGFPLDAAELGIELGVANNSVVRRNTISQHKSRALRIMRQAKTQAQPPLGIEHEKTE